jgi:hypothetical protein
MKVHSENIELMTKEYAQGLWKWYPTEKSGINPDLSDPDDEV